MKKVVLDTNALMLPIQFKVDIFAELARLMDEPFEVVTCSSVIKELGTIARGKGKDGIAARFALRLLEKHNVKILESFNYKYADDWIVKFAKEEHAVVCTSDFDLRRRLQKQKLRVITLKEKNYLGFV
ncbi:MAG: PIN domain-containing protein [Candidatus Micrarchaeota archaeon]